MRSFMSQAAQKVHEATALLHFSIEALKESDHAAFLQVGIIIIFSIVVNPPDTVAARSDSRRISL